MKMKNMLCNIFVVLLTTSCYSKNYYSAENCKDFHRRYDFYKRLEISQEYRYSTEEIRDSLKYFERKIIECKLQEELNSKR